MKTFTKTTTTTTMIRHLFVAATILTMNNDSSLTQAQQIGVDICACSPSTFEFTLDLSLTCPPVNVTTGSGVSRTSCGIAPFGGPSVVDLVPVEVETISISELDQNSQIIAQSLIDRSHSTVDTFTYASISNAPDQITSVNSVPRGLQLDLVGLNAQGESLLNSFSLIYTNRCDIYPVLFEGQSAGWVRFTSLGYPKQELCPLAPAPVPVTPAPTVAAPPPPTAAPSSAAVVTSPQPTTIGMSMSMGYTSSNDWMRMLVEDNFEIEFTEFGREKKLRRRRDRH